MTTTKTKNTQRREDYLFFSGIGIGILNAILGGLTTWDFPAVAIALIGLSLTTAAYLLAIARKNDGA